MPSQFDVQRAIDYDQKQGYTPDQIKTIQRVTGSTPDAVWGAKTVQAVADWQARVGLEPDGKVGTGTWRAVQRVAAVDAAHGRGERKPKLGVWVDDQPSFVLADGWLANLAKLGFSTIAIMVQRSTSASSVEPWAARWTSQQLGKLHAIAKPLGLDVALTTWPLPDAKQLEQMAEALPALLEAAGASALEVDTEGNWTEARLSGFASMADAAKALISTMHAATRASKAKLELTTYPYHPENDAKAQVAPAMGRLFPQAYSVAEREGKPVAWDDPRMGPGGIQALSVHRAEAVAGVAEGKVELGLGLAAYEQAFAGHTIAEAMAAALDAAILQRVPEVRYWSSRWIVGSNGNREVADFFAARATPR
ncbi:peptidoglycan-binding domain-containing protein [Nannocystaceae bacterium ST9]